MKNSLCATGALPEPGTQAPARPAGAVAAFFKKRRLQLALGALIAGLAALLALQLLRLAACTTSWSLRYRSPLSGQAAAAARYYAAQNTETGLWPTFWSEADLALKSELAQAPARCLVYSGEGDLVWPARFTAGGWPGATDEAGCVVSTALAWLLWGSQDVVGNTLTIDGKPCQVRGVMQEDSLLCLARTGDTGYEPGWQAVEFRRAEGLQKTDIETFTAASGLGTADTLFAGGIYSLGAALALLPVFVLVLGLLPAWLYRLTRRHPTPAKIALALGMLALVLALPRLLGLLPAWAVPARWSDFSHWTGLMQQFSSFINTLVATAPTLRDVLAKKTLLWLLAGSCAACPLVAWFCHSLRRPAAVPAMAGNTLHHKDSTPPSTL